MGAGLRKKSAPAEIRTLNLLTLVPFRGFEVSISSFLHSKYKSLDLHIKFISTLLD